MIKYGFTTFMLGLIFACSIFYLVRYSKLSVIYALWWIGMALLIFIASIFPQSLDMLGFALGVNYPPILFVIVALLVLALRMFFADIHRTNLEIKLRKIAQNQAQLIGRINQLEQIAKQEKEASSTSKLKL